MVAGVKQILIPLRSQGLTIEQVMPYLSDIVNQFRLNREQIRADYDYYCLNHNVWNKVRPHDDEDDINNKVLEPHLASMIDWKTGYVLGNPIKYAQSETRQIDDIKYLNKYVRCSQKRTIDSDVATWTYATGVGFYFIQPKTKDFDILYQAPFELYMREADSCCKIYSSFNGKEPLFDMLFTTIKEIDENDYVRYYDIIDLYLPNNFYEYKAQKGQNAFFLVRQERRTLYHELPLIEKRLRNGIGLVAKLKPIQDALDNIASGNMDNLQEVVNVIYKYKGINIGETEDQKIAFHKSVKKNGAIEIPYVQGAPEQGDLDICKTEALDLSDVAVFRNELKRTAYETAGVPLSTSDTNSGGTTKSGSEVANGYDNAYNRALADINDFISADYELLDRMLLICHNTPGNKIDQLHASEIDIKYCLNLSDNILAKAQAASDLYNIGVPCGKILEITHLSNDSEAEGVLWEENIAKRQAQGDKIQGEDVVNQKTVNKPLE